MNRGAMSTLRYRASAISTAFCLAFCVILGGCGSATPVAEAPLAGARIGGPFELIDSQGQGVDWDDFDGRYRMVYFGYAYCPAVCPMDVQRMMKGFAQSKPAEPELAAQVQPIFITIDPARATPEVVGEFTAAFSEDL